MRHAVLSSGGRPGCPVRFFGLSPCPTANRCWFALCSLSLEEHKKKVEIDGARTRRQLHAQPFRYPARTQHAANPTEGREALRRSTCDCRRAARPWRCLCPVRRSWAVSVALSPMCVPHCPVFWAAGYAAGHVSRALGRQCGQPGAAIPTRAQAGGCVHARADAGIRGQASARAARSPCGLPDQIWVGYLAIATMQEISGDQ